MLISEIKSIICTAIEKQLFVTLRYNDDSLDRKFNPYHLYIASTDNTLVSGFQVSNPNKLTENNIYHTFNVQQIKNIALTDQAFSPQPTLTASPQKYKQLICSINKF
jgi:hypothetical protein